MVTRHLYCRYLKNFLFGILLSLILLLLTASMFLQISTKPSWSDQISHPMADQGSRSMRESQVLITVKTTRKYHGNRVQAIVDTWFHFAKEDVYIITDGKDEKLNEMTDGHLITTRCPSSHQRQALCCKLQSEYETYMKYSHSWWCHFDDDNYVNVPRLHRLLSMYDPSMDWYLGKSSTSRPVQVPSLDDNDDKSKTEDFSFWFATGGAGFCLSRSIAMKMISYVPDGRFEALCDRIRLPDDVTLGYLIGYFLGRNLTTVTSFHSHLEKMESLELLRDQVSFGVKAGNGDSLDEMMELHCYLYPKEAICSQ